MWLFFLCAFSFGLYSVPKFVQGRPEYADVQADKGVFGKTAFGKDCFFGDLNFCLDVYFLYDTIIFGKLFSEVLKMSDIILRAARLEDAGQCSDIYSYYVKNTAITYEYDAPSAEEFRGRMADTLAKYPFIVAEKDGKILGYCYAGRFKKRAAYDRMVETTVYLDLNARGYGIGRRLYEMLEEVLKAQGIIKTLAVITLPTTEEEKTVYKSVGFHERNGYKLSGKISCSGYKFGRWYDTVLMDKFIGHPEENMPPIKTFDEVRKQFLL